MRQASIGSPPDLSPSEWLYSAYLSAHAAYPENLDTRPIQPLDAEAHLSCAECCGGMPGLAMGVSDQATVTAS